MATGDTLTEFTGGGQSLAFSPDGSTLAGHTGWINGNFIQLWDVQTGSPLSTLTGYWNTVTSVAFSPDGRTLASSGSWTRGIRLWDGHTGQHLQTLQKNRGANSITFSPNGRILASTGSSASSGGKYIHLWDVQTGQPLQTLQGHTDHVLSVVFSPDGSTLASGSWDDTVRVWDAATGDTLNTLTGHTDRVTSVVFSPDGTILASGSWDDTVRVWDAATGDTLNTLTGHTDRVTSVVFSPDGTILASGSWDDTVRVWDAATGDTLNTLTGHTRGVESIAFSPDGTILASGSWDRTVRLWDVATGEMLNTLTGHTAARVYSSVESIAFSPDGSTLASGSEDGTVLLWPLAPSAATAGQIAADINGDGVVTTVDLALVALRFGEMGADIPADVNGDGLVDIEDLVLVAAVIGEEVVVVAEEAAVVVVAEEAAAPAITKADIETGHLQAADVQQWLTQAQGLDLANPAYQRGIAVLEQLLSALSRQVLPVPRETALLANYPNPFNPETWIPYALAETAEVTVSIYAADGKLVRTLALGQLPAGVYQTRTRAAYWDGRNAQGEPVASGIYFYTLQAGDFTSTKKMVIRK